ncbi:sulfotransferase family 2 domain-containing protein [Microbulbifer sp. CnH-101-G]|uniref:sulfotransferase family 2 domain-containing protein n=1 Tax=Microbulbifer sp. CnH-101-G TaxID=3243393 RepID=UPI00403930B2
MKKLLRKLANQTTPDTNLEDQPLTTLRQPSGLTLPPKIYFCHVPKCAGSSLDSAFRNQLYTPNKLGQFDIKLEESRYAASILDTSMMSVRETVLAYNLSIKTNFFGSGHCFCRPNLVKNFSPEWNFFTALRDPVERWISLYTYNTFKLSKWAKNTLPLNEYIQSHKGISAGLSFIHYFSDFSQAPRSNPADYIEQAIRNLQRFSIVGSTEHLDQLAQQTEKVFQVKLNLPRLNETPNSELAQQLRSTPEIIKKIEHICRHDTEIYKRFLGEFGPVYSKEFHAIN